MDLTAVIAVRGGSTRVKDKNCRPFAEDSLLGVKIKQLQKVEEIKEIIVTSDSEKLLQIAKDNGAIPKKRPLKFCDEKTVPFNEVVRYIASEQVSTRYIMWTPCVCPLVSEEYMREGIEMYKKQIMGELNGQGICTVTPFKEYLLDETGPVNYKVEEFVRSQDLPDWNYIINGFFIAETNQMIDWGFIYGKNPFLFSIPKNDAIDIDDMTDFEIAEFMFQKRFRGGIVD